MRRCVRVVTSAAIFLAVFMGTASALSIPNPDPGTFEVPGADPGYFTPQDAVFTLRFADLGPSLGLAGSRFGFYFEGADVSDPANLITIFDSLDGPGSEAAIDFLGGVVYDKPSYSVQDTFAGAGNIGFFLQPDPVISFFLLGGATTAYTDPSLNLGGEDLVGTFRARGTEDSFLLIFLGQDANTLEVRPLTFELISGIRQVPEPGTWMLLACGLVSLGAAAHRRRRARRHRVM